MKKMILLGSDGNIGKQVLEILKKNKKYQIVALSIGNNYDEHKIIDEVKKILKDNLNIKAICIRTNKYFNKLCLLFPNIIFFYGNSGLIKLIKNVKSNIIFNALSGFVGLKPTIFALKKKINVALANKETLVVGGEIISKILKKYKSKIFPVDSEHSAIYRCLKKIKNKKNEIEKIFITASGGSFRDFNRKQLKNVTPEQALLHPTWKMGNKITIDSADMINKGFEIMEAHYLFNFPISKIKILMHRESHVHAIVKLKNGLYIGDISKPDMSFPIRYSLKINTSLNSVKEVNDLKKFGYNFNNFDFKRFPMVKYVLDAAKKKGLFPCIINAVNEIAVDAFLKKKISFLDIEKIVKLSLKTFKKNILNPNLSLLIKTNNKACNWAKNIIKHYGK